MLSSLVALALGVLPAFVKAYPEPIGCSGDCFSHDPFVMQRYDGKYFRYETSAGVNIRTADSLLGPWTDVGRVVTGASVIDDIGISNDDLWVSILFYSQFGGPLPAITISDII